MTRERTAPIPGAWSRSTSGAPIRPKRPRLVALRRAFPAKVLEVSEFGGEGTGQNAASAPGGLVYQASLVRTHLDVYRSTPGLAGALVWALRDFAVSPAFAGGSIRRLVPVSSSSAASTRRAVHPRRRPEARLPHRPRRRARALRRPVWTARRGSPKRLDHVPIRSKLGGPEPMASAC